MRNFIFLIAIFAFVTSHSKATNLLIDDDVVISISQNDLIIISDVSIVMEYAKTKGLSDRALEQIKIADEAYEKGVQLMQQSDNEKAIISFKTAFKNYKRAKLNDDALNFPNLQLALSHQLTNDNRNQKKVVRYLELVTKNVEKEKEWLYNLAILNFLNNNENLAAEQLEAVIKLDKNFFKAYGNLAAVYQSINESKKSDKILNKLKYAQSDLAEKKRKEQLAIAKQKEKAKDSNKIDKIKIKSQPPKGINIDPISLVAKGDGKTVLRNEIITDFDDRLRKKIREGQELYDQGIVLFNSGEYSLAIKAFKSSLKKFNQAKVSQLTLSYVNANLAMSYFRSSEKRDKKKVSPILDILSKKVYDDRDLTYNIAVMQYGLGNKEKSIDLLEQCSSIDKYFLMSYQNQVAIHNELDDLKSAKRAFKNHEKYKNELTEVYKQYVRTGVKNNDLDLSFLDGAIFRVALGNFSEFNMPIDIYLHDDLITIPLGNDFYTFICGNYDTFKQAEYYLAKVSSNGYDEAFIIAFKNGIRTDFASEF